MTRVVLFARRATRILIRHAVSDFQIEQLQLNFTLRDYRAFMEKGQQSNSRSKLGDRPSFHSADESNSDGLVERVVAHLWICESVCIPVGNDFCGGKALAEQSAKRRLRCTSSHAKGSPASHALRHPKPTSFEFLVIALDRPTPLGRIDELAPRSLLGQCQKPVCGRIALIFLWELEYYVTQ